MTDMEKIVAKNAKLSVAKKDNCNPEYNEKVESAYIRQDKMLAAKLKEKHGRMLAELSASFASNDEASFSATMEKLSKMGEVLSEGSDTDAAGYLASFAEDTEIVDDKKAELSALSEQVKGIETMLASVLAGNKPVKFAADTPTVDDEQIEKKLFNDLDRIVETLKKSHAKYGGK